MEKFEDLKGKVLSAVDGKIGGDEIVFTLENGDKYMLFHEQDCCETVEIIDIIGDLPDLVGSEILRAEEVVSDTHPDDKKDMEAIDSYTWTFYKLATIKGSVTIRWYGTSNGFYSERVSFYEWFPR